MMKIQFLGAAQTVTGSRTLVSFRGYNTLVDCGLFQGPKALRALNWEPFSALDKINSVILTHAHIDHSGFLPRVVREGYSGPIYASSGTFDLCKILLPDSAYLQVEDAEFANVTKHSRHQPALPLYNITDVEKTLKQFQVVERDKWHTLSEHISFQMLRAGHIIGSSLVQMNFQNGHGVGLLTFTGDLGNGRSPTLNGPVTGIETDYLVLESTYGNRMQPRVSPLEDLAKAVNKVIGRGGALLIPAFSVGRTQDLLFLLRQLEDQNKIPSVPVYLDSPMSSNATRIFNDHPEDHRIIIEGGQVVSPVCPSCYEEVRSTSESMKLTMKTGPMIVISAAGMLSGGRILHHLKNKLPHEQNGVLFVGYQAEETKGRLLQEGIDELRIHHTPIPVRAEILTIDSLSAHADLADILDWLKTFRRAPKKIFLNHGERAAAEALAGQIKTHFGYETVIAEINQVYELNLK